MEAYLFLFCDWASKRDASIGGVHNVPKVPVLCGSYNF